jgi:hypothetical protein
MRGIRPSASQRDEAFIIDQAMDGKGVQPLIAQRRRMASPARASSPLPAGEA